MEVYRILLIPRLLFPSTNYKSLATQGHDENSKERNKRRDERGVSQAIFLPISFFLTLEMIPHVENPQGLSPILPVPNVPLGISHWSPRKFL
ncbi:hypothetical protein PanWU01x14_229910, partial [Parasponia andersonii]